MKLFDYEYSKKESHKIIRDAVLLGIIIFVALVTTGVLFGGGQ